MTFGELFAGIGGFSLGLERAGMTCKWQVEIDPYATAVLRKHWPDVPKHDDVRTFPPHTHTHDYSVDLICGGFPCQDISVAGKGAGLAGARSGLWYEFARIIRTVRPRWVVIENVPALTARGLGTVLGDLAEIGFDAEWHCIPACSVGAPHRRDRIWIVARNTDGGDERAITGVQSGKNSISRRVCGDAVRYSDCQREAGDGDSNAKHGGAVSQEARRKPVRVSGESDVADASRGGQPIVRCSSWSARHADKCCADVADAKGVRSRAGFCQDDTKQDRHQSRDGCRDVTDSNRAGRQQQRRPESAPAEQPAAECGGWWESEPDVGRVAHGVSSRVDRLRCLGNAVVPQVVEVIGRAILEAEARMTS